MQRQSRGRYGGGGHCQSGLSSWTRYGAVRELQMQLLVAVATVPSAAATTSTCVAVQINRGVLTYLNNNEQGPEKLVVILDCRGATAMQVSHLRHQVVWMLLGEFRHGWYAYTPHMLTQVAAAAA